MGHVVKWLWSNIQLLKVLYPFSKMPVDKLTKHQAKVGDVNENRPGIIKQMIQI